MPGVRTDRERVRDAGVKCFYVQRELSVGRFTLTVRPDEGGNIRWIS